MIRDVQLTVSLFHPGDVPQHAAPLDMGAVPQAPAPAGLGDGSLIDLGAKLLTDLLKAALRRRGLITALLVAVLLLGSTATASAGGFTRCGGGNGRQGGPVRNLIGRIADNAAERRAARGCQPQAVGFPAAAAVAGVSGPVSGCAGGGCYSAGGGAASNCPGGVCPRQ